MPFTLLGTGPLLGHALQTAWDRPVLGTGPLKCLGQARSGDMPSKMIGTGPFLGQALQNSWGTRRRRTPSGIDRHTTKPNSVWEDSTRITSREDRTLLNCSLHLPHRSPGCAYTTSFSDMCPELTAVFKSAVGVGSKRPSTHGR